MSELIKLDEWRRGTPRHPNQGRVVELGSQMRALEYCTIITGGATFIAVPGER